MFFWKNWIKFFFQFLNCVFLATGTEFFRILYVYSLKAAKNIFSEKHLRTLYFSLFHCHLTYALEVWSSVSPAQLQPLIKKQKTTIRIVGGGEIQLPHRTSLQITILPLSDLITLTNLKIFHSYVYNYIPEAFHNTWPRNRDNRDTSERELRNDDDFHIPRHRTDFISQFPFFNLPKVWNDTPVNLTSTSHKKNIHN